MAYIKVAIIGFDIDDLVETILKYLEQLVPIVV